MKSGPQIRYFTSGKWHDMERNAAAQMMREYRLNPSGAGNWSSSCVRSAPGLYLLYEPYDNSVWIKTSASHP